MLPINLKVNGDSYDVLVNASDRLVDVLREKLDLTGTKKGCGAGECGACSVLLDGKLVNSCLILAVQADGSEITTIEGVAENGQLHPVQQAFLDVGAVQCGFCTPGMVLAAKSFLDEHKNYSDAELRHEMAGNICRCTGYEKIIEAIKSAAKKRR